MFKAIKIRVLKFSKFRKPNALRLMTLMWENTDIDTNSIVVKYNIDNHSVSLKDCKLTSPKTLDSFKVVSINNRCLEILSHLKVLNSRLDIKNDKSILKMNVEI